MNKQTLSGLTVIVGITGSIAAYKAADLVSRLRKEEADVSTVMTPDAIRFVAPLTYQALSGNQVFTDMFAREHSHNPRHISLADRADVIVIAPATADFIGKIAAGRADDLLSAVVMTFKGPVLIAPAMNSAMYANPILRKNIDTLTDYGYRFIGPEKGYLACGEEGAGRMTEPADILAALNRQLAEAGRKEPEYLSKSD